MRYMVMSNLTYKKDDFIPNMTRSFETRCCKLYYEMMQLKFVYLLQLTDKEQGRLLTEMPYISKD